MSEQTDKTISPPARVQAWIFIALAGGLPLVLVGVAHYWKGKPIGAFMRDPIAAGKLPIYTGMVSQLGFFCWGAAVGTCMLGARLLRNQHPIIPDAGGPPLRALIIGMGMFSILLGLDDGLLLHDEVFPRLGISEYVTQACYAVMMVGFLALFARTILTTRFLLLGIALFAFACSAVVDVTFPDHLKPGLVEDGPKFVGIIAWLAYCMSIGRQASEAGRSTPAPHA